MLSKNLFAGSILVVVLVGATIVGAAPEAFIDDIHQTRVALANTSTHDGDVSGEIVNNLPHAVRDVQLLVRHVWLWNNEFRPGVDDPGQSVYYTVEKTIPPRGKIPFTYRADGLPKRADGHFETTVSIAGYAEIIQP